MSVTVLRFRVGESAFALAAGCVETIGPVRTEVPHLSWVLERQLPTITTGSRTLHVVAPSGRVELMVDGPVEVMELDTDDVAPCRTTASSTVMGFARAGDEVVALLDAAVLVELVHKAAPEELAR